MTTDGLVSTLVPLLPLDAVARLAQSLVHSPPAGLFLILVLIECVYLSGVALALLLGEGASRRPQLYRDHGKLPVVSCIITCYSEGLLVQRTIASLLDQDYPGEIEILPVVDGALQNSTTLMAAREMEPEAGRYPQRRLRVLPKWIRGGRASSLNAGLAVARGEVLLALDGDTSFDRDMISRVLVYFRRPEVVAVAGTLRVRNRSVNLLTRLQAIDYLLFRQFVRAGLGAINTVNNIPGAHGAFRADVLRMAGGWDNGTAEDVDLAHRLKCCFGRYPEWRIAVAPDVISHTDVPERWMEFLRQRLRWEGDPVYLFLRKHGPLMSPALMGWRNYLFALWYGLVFQILMPPLMLLALVMMALTPANALLAVMGVGYGVYLAVVAGLFLLHIGLTSERPGLDLGQAWLLPLYPLFIFMLRAWCGVAVAYSLLARSHRDTTMAPWWVLRKGRF